MSVVTLSSIKGSRCCIKQET